MSDVLPKTPPVSGAIEAYGVGSAVPVAARGTSLVLAAPPSPAYAVPILAALINRTDDTSRRPSLLIAPESSLEAWAQAAALAASSQSKVAAAGPFPSRAAHHLASGRVDLVVTTLATASELIRRSTLRMDTIGALVVAWPELELSADNFLALFADLPKETQRIVVTADPVATAEFTERYAWRAPQMGPLGNDPADPVQPRLRVATVRWDDRLSALASAADLLDVDELAVWTADQSSHWVITERLASHGVVARPGASSIPGSGATIFFDAPPPELLGQASAERSIALVPPGTERYFARIVGRLEPMTLPGPLDQAERAMVDDRRAIRARLEAGLDRGAYATVAPLLDRFSAAEVAVTLQSLWSEARTRPTPSPTPVPAPRAAAHPKVWINVGKKDGVSHGELLALLTLDLSLPRTALGKLEMKDTFTLIELTSEEDARRAVERLAGHTFKQRRLTARIDRGRDQRRAP